MDFEREQQLMPQVGLPMHQVFQQLPDAESGLWAPFWIAIGIILRQGINV